MACYDRTGYDTIVHNSDGGMIRLETLIELKFLNSSIYRVCEQRERERYTHIYIYRYRY